MAWLAAARPASLAARLKGPVEDRQPVADRIILFALLVGICGWMIFLPLDVFHFHLLGRPPEAVSWAGGAIYLAGWGVMFTAIFQNRFAAPVVQDQTDQGQAIVDTGLYGIVRHPLYSGVLLLLAGMALWLESLAGLAGVLGLLAILGARIAVEEAEMRKTLPGYADFARRVRFRLIPFVL